MPRTLIRPSARHFPERAIRREVRQVPYYPCYACPASKSCRASIGGKTCFPNCLKHRRKMPGMDLRRIFEGGLPIFVKLPAKDAWRGLAGERSWGAGRQMWRWRARRAADCEWNLQPTLNEGGPVGFIANSVAKTLRPCNIRSGGRTLPQIARRGVARRPMYQQVR